MKTLLNTILNLSGFDNLQDYMGKSSVLVNAAAPSIFYLGGLVGFIETYSGISFMFWIFLVLGTLFDLGLGTYTNVFYLNQGFETKKFYRGVFKSFVVLVMIFITNQLKLGIETSNITPDFMATLGTFTIATVHYSVVFLISLYLLLGVSENGEKLGLRVCASINKIVRLKIKKIEGASNENQELNK